MRDDDPAIQHFDTVWSELFPYNLPPAPSLWSKWIERFGGDALLAAMVQLRKNLIRQRGSEQKSLHEQMSVLLQWKLCRFCGHPMRPKGVRRGRMSSSTRKGVRTVGKRLVSRG